MKIIEIIEFIRMKDIMCMTIDERRPDSYRETFSTIISACTSAVHKGYIFMCLGLLLFSQLIAQKDTAKVINWYEYELENGVVSEKKYAKEQTTFTNDDRVIRQVSFSAQPSAITGYVWYFYNKNKRLSGEERYDGSDELIVAIQYIYDDKGVKTGSHQFKPDGNNELKLFMDETIIYDVSGQVILETGIYASGGTAYKRKYKYDEKGTVIAYKCKSSEAICPCELTNIKAKPAYDSERRLSSSSRVEKTASGITRKIKDQREYNANGYLRKVSMTITVKKQATQRVELYRDGYIVELTEKNEAGEIIRKEEYTYLIHNVNQVMPVAKYLKN